MIVKIGYSDSKRSGRKSKTADLLGSRRMYEPWENALHEQELSLRNQGFRSVDEIGPIPNKIDSLDLTGNALTNVVDLPLLSEPLTRLRTLLLANNQLRIIASDISSKMPNLVSISLANNQIDDWKAVQFIATLPKLKHLIIQGNPITKDESYRQKLRESQPNLKYVDFAVVKAPKKVSKENQHRVEELMKKLEEATTIDEVEKIEKESAEMT